MCVISGCRQEVDEICALLCYYTASGGSFLTTFRDNLSAPYSGVNPVDLYWVLDPPEDATETSVRNYHYLLRDNPEVRSSQLFMFVCVCSFLFLSPLFSCCHLLCKIKLLHIVSIL